MWPPFPQPTVFTFASLTCTRSSPHTQLLHSPHVVLLQCLLDWATERLVASFPLVPRRNVPHPEGLAAHFPIGPWSKNFIPILNWAFIFPCKIIIMYQSYLNYCIIHCYTQCFSIWFYINWNIWNVARTSVKNYKKNEYWHGNLSSL